MNLGVIQVKKEKDIIIIRQAIKSLCSKIGFSNVDTIRVITAGSELTRNLYEHSSGGEISFELIQNATAGLKLVFQDEGPGIKNLDKILRGGFKSKSGMGIGLIGAKNLMDEFKIDSSETGTKIEIIKWSKFGKKISKKQLQEIKAVMAEISEESALESFKAQSRDLIVILEELREKNTQLERANQELEEKNLRLKDFMEELQRSTVEIRETMTELEKTNKEMELFVETIPDGILVMTTDGKIRFANATFKEFFERAVNQPFDQQINLKELDAELNLFLGTLDDILTKDVEISRTINVLENFWLQIFSKFVRLSKNSKPFAIIVEMRDVTPFIEFDNLRKQFVSTVSHELRTPITSISLSISNLIKYKDQLSEQKKDKLIKMISESASVLSEMIEDLLILSRLDSKRFELKFEEYNLKRILESVILQLEAKIKSKQMTVELECDDKISLIGDKTRISQIFRILLDNATKYSPENSKILIRAIDHYLGEYNTENLNGCLVKVIDNGIGIPKEDLDKIFDRFYRAEEVQEIDGTGLGLSIAKELISLHNGKIYVESEYKKGSTFSVFFEHSEE